MKTNNIFIASALLCSVFIVGIAAPTSGQSKKAASALSKTLPIDPAIRTGKLANGLTYYIRRNEQPKNRVELYLVNKVGSILEDADQRGLAHFMEHMNFNGTKNFPKNQLVDYLQKAGVRFGADLNAYTGFDETVYQLPIPTNDPTLLPSGLKIMRDWAQEALLDSVEIEKERGVILEEERLGKGARDRMSRQSLPMLLNYSHYAERIPIGKDTILTTFKPATLKRFYHDWYRPDLQALIVVGDVDVNDVERQIRENFSDLKNPKPERPRIAYNIPLTGKKQFMVITDKEQPATSIEVIFKRPAMVINTEAAYLDEIKRGLLVQLLANRRFAESNKNSNPAFINMSAGIKSLFNQINLFDFAVIPKAGQNKEGFQQAWRILEQIKRFGFTAAELDNAKKIQLQSLEAGFKELDKIPSNVYIKEYVNMFLHQEAVPGIQWEYDFRKSHLPAITLEDINNQLNKFLLAKDVDILISGPDKDKATLPDEQTLQQWIDEVSKENLKPFVDEAQGTVLMPVKPKAGKVVKKESTPALNITTLTLSNGVKVVLKPTTFKNDQISYNGFCPGGTSLYDGSDYDAASLAPEMINLMGVGKLDPIQLSKMLMGKQAGSAVGILADASVVTGGGSIADLETALQLTYLQFTQPREDSVLFRKHLSEMRETLRGQGVDPNSVFNDTVNYVTGNYNYRYAPMTAERLNKISIKRIFDIYKERFADASGFTFVFVGNFTVEGITPLLEQYLGALPSVYRNNVAKDLHIRVPQGVLTKKVFKGTEDKASVRIMLHGDYEFSELNNLYLKALGDILQIKVLEHLREDESEVYSPSVKTGFHKLPFNGYAYVITFGCAPKNVDHLIAMVEKEMKALRDNGPLPDDVQKFKAAYVKTSELSLRDNGFWVKYLVGQLRDNENILSVLGGEHDIDQLNPASLKDAANRYLTGKDMIRFELLPEQTAQQ